MILAAAMIKFQRLFKDLSDMPGNRLDIITNCLTIASACISFFLANYVERDDKRFAIVPAIAIVSVHHANKPSIKPLL